MSICLSQGTQTSLGVYPDKLDGLLNVIAELLVDEVIRESNSLDRKSGVVSNIGPTIKVGGAHV